MKEEFLKEWQALHDQVKADTYVLAISGGIDSVVLAHHLKEAAIPFSMAHCNFKLRGAESDEDEEFVSALAKDLGVKLRVKAFDTEDYAREKGISIQMAARELRYAWFEELCVDQSTCLVTAHHANDVAETMLFNLAKGTGLAGLHGIRGYDGQTVRPLLWATKEDIRRYAEEMQLVWREDQSNEDNKYSRNHIRNKLILEIEKINPAFIDAACRTGKRIADAEKVIDFYVAEQEMVREEDGHTFINKKKLLALPGAATILYRLISDFGFNYDQVDDILRSADRTGAMFHTRNWSLNVDRSELIITSIDEPHEQLTIESANCTISYSGKRLICRTVDRNEYVLNSDSAIAALSHDQLKFPLRLRRYREGDRFSPLGMKGSKLISDILIDEKVPVALKKEQFVITSGDDIVWLVGRRIDDRFKITNVTEIVFEIRLENA